MSIKGIDTVIAKASCLAAAIHEAAAGPALDEGYIASLRLQYLWAAERITSEAVRQFRIKRARPSIPPITLTTGPDAGQHPQAL